MATLTLEALRAMSRTAIALPAEFGEGMTLTVRKLSAGEFLAFLPPDPPEAETWPERGPERAACERAWFDALTPAQQETRRTAVLNTDAGLLARASVEPVLSMQDALALGNALGPAVNALLGFSGLLAPEPTST